LTKGKFSGQIPISRASRGRRGSSSMPSSLSCRPLPYPFYPRSGGGGYPPEGLLEPGPWQSLAPVCGGARRAYFSSMRPIRWCPNLDPNVNGREAFGRQIRTLPPIRQGRACRRAVL
jgi:hypothetical protein